MNYKFWITIIVKQLNAQGVDLVLLSYVLFLFTGCSRTVDTDLIKMSFEEEIEQRIQKQFDLSATIIYDQDGKEINETHLDSIKKGLVGFDHYRGESNLIKRTNIRNRQYMDNVMIAVVSKYDSLFKNMNVHNIDCERLEVEIDLQFDIIPGFRVDSIDITEHNVYEIRQNRYLSILNKCEYQDVVKMDEDHKRKFWLEYQHSGAEKMSTYYYPLMHKLFKEKELTAQCMALSIDRILMNGNYKQIYGSQLMNGQLWPIADTTKLDSIRLSMGMKTMKEYLEYF